MLDVEAVTEAEAEGEGEKVDSYQSAVRSLNRGADRKLQRKRTEYALAPERPSASVGYSVEARSRSAARAPMAASRVAEKLDGDVAERFESAEEMGQAVRVEKSIAQESSRPSSSSRLAAVPRGQRVVEVDSVVGHWVGEGANRDYIVLHRTATLAGGLYRQGLVIDIGRLADSLRDDVLRGEPLEDRAQLELVLAGARSAWARPKGDYSYRHRFADPFDDIAAVLALPMLADAGGSDYLYLLSGLLLVVGTVGLFALYRMVYVTVAFADRRNNFVAAVSHELKTPLTAIRMYGEMLRDDMVPSEDKRHEYYATITAESERLTRLINNVLEFSRIEQGTREMSLVAGAIGPVIAEAAELLVPHAREQGFAIEVDVAPGLPAVRFDRDALLQVVFNLVDNALKYARSSNDRVIRLDARQVGDSVVLTVRDRGPGVSAEHLAKIFEPFYRGQKELTRTAKGTGIGLALVKGLCERMGAAVTGRNGSDGGFEVRLTFRLA
jgi:signal transduction histidine kinase